MIRQVTAYPVVAQSDPHGSLIDYAIAGKSRSPRDPGLLPSARVTAFAQIGMGNNIIYVDPEHDAVAMMRWIEGGAADGFVNRLLAALYFQHALHHRHAAAADPHPGDAAVALLGAGFEQARAAHVDALGDPQF
jgi:hypothetical protein